MQSLIVLAMRKRFYQTILSGVILALLSTAFLGCQNSGGKQADSNKKKIPNITAKEAFQVFRKDLDGNISKQWLLSDSLSEHATIEEIEELATIKDDPVMRLIAFRALLSKDPHEAVDLAISHFGDTTKVFTVNLRCALMDEVSRIRIEMLQSDEYQISKEDLARIASTVLFSANISKYVYSLKLYQSLPAKPEYEDRLRQIYKQDPWTLVALAKYNKEKDKQEIIRLFSQAENKDFQDYSDTLSVALYAVAEWPDATFIPFIQRECKKIFEQQDSEGCDVAALCTLIAYNSQWSYDIAERALAKAKENDKNFYLVCRIFHHDYEQNPQPLFKPLIEKYPLEE